MRLPLVLLVPAALLAQGGANPVTQALNGRYQAVRQNLMEAAEVMPAEQYAFKLTPAQRTYGEWVAHTAAANENACRQMTGATVAPMDHSKHGGGAKDELVAMFRESFATCDAAFAAMTDAKLVAPVGEKKVLPVNPAVGLVATLNSHYGNMVGYLRSKGLTPPSTARAQKR